MAAENFDIIFRVVGGKVATAELASVAKGSEEVGAAQVVAAKKGEGASKSMVKQAAVLGGLYAGYKLLKNSVSTTTELTRNTLAFQRATGLDMKTAQAWVVTAQHRDISVKQLQQSMGTLGRSLGATTKPTTASAYAFKQLGVSFDALKSQGPEQRMETLANAFQKLPNGVNKAALAQKLFGRAGQGLLPILNQGAKGMNEQLDAAKKLVPPVAKNAKQAQELMQSQRELHGAMTGLEVVIGSALIPILTSLARVLGPIVGWFNQAMQKSALFKDAIYVLTAAIGGLVIATKILRPALIALGVSEDAAFGPIGLAVAGIAALAAAFYLAYHHVKFFHDAVDAVVGFIKSNWKTVITVAAALLLGPFVGALVLVVTHLHTFENVASSVVNRVKAIFSGMVSFFSSLPGRITSAVVGLFNGLFNAATDVIRKIESLFSNLGSTITSDIGHAFSSLPSKALSVLGIKAEGGPINQTGPYLVGERGPEIVTLTRGQTVVPNHALGALGGGGATINVPVYLDRKQIALAVGRYTGDQQKRR